VLGAALIFRLVGVQARNDEALPAWARKTLMALTLGLGLFVPPLFLQVLETYQTGQARPLTYPVAPHVRDAVRSFIETKPKTDLLSIGRHSTEPQMGITVIVTTENNVPEDFEEQLISVIDKARSDSSKVRVFTLLEAPSATD